MNINDLIAIGYGFFLLVILIINLLYVFQVYQYRLKGDASIMVLAVHIIIVLTVIFASSILII